MNFEFATAQRLLFGPGRSKELPALLPEIGHRLLLVHGRAVQDRGGPAARLIRTLEETGLIVETLAVGGEPDLALVESGAAAAREHPVDAVVGIGGGSVLDAAKAIAGFVTNPGPARQHLEGVGEGNPLGTPALPVIAVPTTAGTGSEATRNAVIAVPEAGVKVSLRHPSLLPRLAVVDPLLTHDLPPEVTARTGLDALTQLMEAYVSRRSNPITDALCREGLAYLVPALPIACREPRNERAREGMSLGSLLSGIALANAGLGLVHGIAGPLGGAFPIPHGACCAALLPRATGVNIRALRQRAPRHPALDRYEAVAQLLTDDGDAAEAESLPGRLLQLVTSLGISGLSDFGVREAAIPDLAEKASRASSTRTNPIDLSLPEIESALRAAL